MKIPFPPPVVWWREWCVLFWEENRLFSGEQSVNMTAEIGFYEETILNSWKAQ